MDMTNNSKEGPVALPTSAIKEDARLEKQASSASEELARHRWHWTLNPENLKRISIREYARAVGRAHKTIEAQVNAYAKWSSGTGARPNLNEEIERARMSAEKEAVVGAVAEARNTSFGQTRKTRPTEIRRVREIARERAEKHGTDVAEEARKVAEWVVRSEKAEKAVAEERAKHTNLRFIAVEGHLMKAQRALNDALNESRFVTGWGDDEREILTQTIARVKDLLGLVDASLTGTADVDWDAELARIADGVV